MTKPLVGILGGTFDPIHFGHLRMAQELAETLRLSEIRFIPSANPPHRSAPMSAPHLRAAMVKLAIQDNPLFTLDERELKRGGDSYTYDTLISLKADLNKDISLCLLLGSDAFLNLTTWHRWDELLSLCHIIVAHRPNAEPDPGNMPSSLRKLWERCVSSDHDDLIKTSTGRILMQQITALDISATAIREDYKSGTSPRYLMPDSVIDYIHEHGLYQ